MSRTDYFQVSRKFFLQKNKLHTGKNRNFGYLCVKIAAIVPDEAQSPLCGRRSSEQKR